MGKGNLIIGTASKKLGDIVFYRTGGEQRFRVRVKPMNPRTNAQLIQRCVVSTAVKFYSNVAELCNHAFQNYTGNLKNHQRFMKLNIMKLRQVALSQVISWSPIRWSTTKLWNWAKKDDVNSYVNPYILSEGDLEGVNVQWSGLSYLGNANVPFIEIFRKSGEAVNIEQITYSDVINHLGLNQGDQLTFITCTANLNTGAIEKTAYYRIILLPDNGDISTAFLTSASNGRYSINSPNKENFGNGFFYARGNRDSDNEWVALHFSPTTDDSEARQIAGGAIIVSRFENNKWRRSNSVLSVPDEFQNLSPLEEAVASYEKSDTSSLYLNQAQSAERQKLEATYAEELGTEVEIEKDIEEKTKRTRKKSEE